MFQIGDKVVHPMHGAGVIDSIVDERINGKTQAYYVFRMPVNGLVLKRGENFLIPHCLDSVDIRGEGKILFVLPPLP